MEEGCATLVLPILLRYQAYILLEVYLKKLIPPGKLFSRLIAFLILLLFIPNAIKMQNYEEQR